MADRMSHTAKLSALLAESNKNIPTRNFTTDTRQIVDKGVNALSDYTVKIMLGEGAFGVVKLAIHNRTKVKVAIKILEKCKIQTELDRERVSRELQILKILRHPNIVQLYEILEDPDNLYLIMEYLQNGELFDHITSNMRLDEREACRIFQQIIDGIEYIHKINVCQRDLKPQNMLMDQHRNIKIIDFGLSNIYKDGGLLRTSCGSPCFAAPEMIKVKKYNPVKVDIWAAGVILFTMLAGYLPFDDNDTQKLYRKIMKAEFKLPTFLSLNAKDLLREILNPYPQKRFDIKKIKEHPWFKTYNGYTNIEKGLIIGYHVIPIDNVIVKQVENFGYDKEVIIQSIKNNRHNKISTIYNLLLKKAIKKGHISNADICSLMFKPKVINEAERINKLVEASLLNGDGKASIKDLKDKIHKDIQKKTEKTNVNNLNNTTILPFEENLSEMGNTVVRKRQRGKTQTIIRNKMNSKVKEKKQFKISQLMDSDNEIDIKTTKTGKDKLNNELIKTEVLTTKVDRSYDDRNVFQNTLSEVKTSNRKNNINKQKKAVSQVNRNRVAKSVTIQKKTKLTNLIEEIDEIKEPFKLKFFHKKKFDSFEEEKPNKPNKPNKPFENITMMKTHRGPLNTKCITKRNPNIVIEEIKVILTKLEITDKSDKLFTLKCQYQSYKFGIEINKVENLEGVFVIKFIKNCKSDLFYMELCNKIINNLALK